MCDRREKGTAVCRGELIENFQALSLHLSLTLSLHTQTNTLRQPFPNAFDVPKLQCLFAFVS
jgi:hypothetical protein